MGKTAVNSENPWLQIALDLWSRRWAILSLTLLASGIGFWSAMTTPKTFEANAIISIKRNSGGPGNAFGQLGGLGGLLSSQLGVPNIGLDRLAFALSTRELVKRVVVAQNLIPTLFPDEWNEKSKSWVNPDSTTHPTLQECVEFVRNNVLRVKTNPKDEIIIISIILRDSSAVVPTVFAFLEALDRSIKEGARRDADSNRAYLEQQLAVTGDPMLREKIASLISTEIEKSLLVASTTFELLEPPISPEMRYGPNRKRIIVMAAAFGFFASSLSFLFLVRVKPLLRSWNTKRIPEG